MIIQLRTEPRGQFKEIDIKKGMTIEDLAIQYTEELPYDVLVAKVNNRLTSLSSKINKECQIEFLDMRTQSANLVYQHSLTLIYLKACNDVLPGVEIEISNSISKGIFTIPHREEPVTEDEIEKIRSRMDEIIAADYPLVMEEVPYDEAVARFAEFGEEEKKSLVDESQKKIRFFNLDGYVNFFYSLMVPSAGYIKHYELMKYKEGIIVRFPHPSDPAVIPPYVEEKMLYQAFEEADEWCKVLGVSFVSDLNRVVDDKEKFRELVQLSEALHEKKVAQIADMILDSGKRLVLIAGPSSSGKTTFARRLCVQLKVNGLRPIYMGTDDYFKNREETPLDQYGEPDYENLNAVDVDLFNQNMKDLLAGKEVDIPTFDFMEGKKIFGKRLTTLASDEILVIEGIHALNDDLTPLIDKSQKFRIYISPLSQLNIDRHNRIPLTDARMLRRMVRDYQYRGHSAQETIKEWPKVRAGEDKNIFPYSDSADVLFNSVHLYEIAVLKKFAEPILKQVTREEAEYAEAARLLRFLRHFRTAKDTDVIVNNSIIREFIGGSVFA